MQNVSNLTTKEFRDNLAEILEKVAIGKQKFLISKFGKKKALLIPADEFKEDIVSKKTPLPGFGIWTKRKNFKNSSLWVSKLRNEQSLRQKISG